MSDKPPSPELIAALKAYGTLNPDDRRSFNLANINNGKKIDIPSDTKIATWADLEGIIGPITWAWPGWLPTGFLTILAGESGAGKSALALRLAACFLRGDQWPDKSKFTGETGLVLWAEAEAAQSLNWERAKSWQLPDDKIITPLDDPLGDVKLDRAEHFAAIYARAQLPDVRLIVIDSLRGANSKDENSSDTIDLVIKLAELARNFQKPIILTHHLRKRSIFDGDSVELERLRGSSAIVQAARLVWALDVPDPNAKNWKRLQVVKSNLAKFPEPVGMTITDQGVTFGLSPETPKVETIIDRAIDLLRALLHDQPMSADAIEQEFDQAGISKPTMKRAKAKLGITSAKRPDGWYWSMPVSGNYGGVDD